MTARRPFRIATKRLVIRPLARSDITEFTRYRNDAEVARFQEWPLPYTRDMAHALLAELDGTNGPTADRWVQLAIIDAEDRLLGDVAVWLDDNATLAMIGYTLSPKHQGHGYATEAAGAVVDWLVAHDVHRVAATLDPLNLASARVLERCGFRYTGTARSAALVRGVWEDDARFEILADERRQWKRIRRARRVELVEITADNVRAVLELDRAFSQRRFVSTVAQSFGDALVTHLHDGVPIVPWYRAVYADGEPVGFIMVAEPAVNAEHPYLWRFLIDWRHQRRGIGARAVRALAAHWRAQGATCLDLNCVPDVVGTPEAFYRRLGFERTGAEEDGQVELRASISELLDRP